MKNKTFALLTLFILFLTSCSFENVRRLKNPPKVAPFKEISVEKTHK